MSPGRGTPHSLWADRKGNIWISEIRGGALSKYEPVVDRGFAFFPSVPDPGTYQPTEDMGGNIWVPAMTKNEILKFDPVTETLTEYKTPTPASGPRRSRLDYQGNVWFTETNGGRLGKIDHTTGRISEYRVPASNSEPYEIWFRKNEDHSVWASDGPNDTIFRLDTKTGKATFYPLPQGPIWAVRKVEVEANNTFWFTTITVKRPAVYHFYPEGYTATAPAEP
jgi:virginiamycin B lyase